MSRSNGINWRYAIGELLIVIIGISIAFWLNTWNEERKQDDLAISYLENLKADLQTDVDSIKGPISALNNTFNYVNNYIKAVYNPALRHDSLSSKVYLIAQTSLFNEQSATYNTLINSGDIKLIRNIDLRTSIVNQYSNYKMLHFKEEIYFNFISDYFGPFMIKNYSYAKGMNSNLDPWENDELINMVMSSYGIVKQQIEANEKAMAGAEKLLVAINEELAKSN